MYYNTRPKKAPKGVIIMCFHPISYIVLNKISCHQLILFKNLMCIILFYFSNSNFLFYIY